MSSGSTCSVHGCRNNSQKLKEFAGTFCLGHKKLRHQCPCPARYFMHTMPRKEEREAAWLAALNLKRRPKRVYVCSFHFVDKRPTVLHPDPELFMGYDLPPPPKRRIVVRGVREKKSRPADSFMNVNQDGENGRKINGCSVDFAMTISDAAGILSSEDPPAPQRCSAHTQWEDPSQLDHDYTKSVGVKNVHDQTTQCDEIGYFMLQNDSDALLYTGVSLETFNILVSTLEGHASNPFTLSVRDQVLLTLMKLRTNRGMADLSKQFHISQSMAREIIPYWIDKLDEVLRPLIPWLPKETIEENLPEEFTEDFPDLTCILDCNEILLQKPRNLDSLNTMKYQVAYAPCGLIMFISAAYGGQCSDTFITKNSGILNYLMPGDEVMAVRGFPIEDVLLKHDVDLAKPFYTKKCGQPTETWLISTRQMASIRVHAERAIRRLKVYRILSQVVPRTVAAKIDKVLRICAALVNLREGRIRDSV
ncbi:uncharacterized protein [Notothenia coriiceps]|uniref:THAP-type domain-containing protein n=1 Tax=Notothenia coriiceps TaxID=8208 RepID=A0A6I9MUD5_9TELE|nr:PREDICTED: uncharacterized protein LOC104945650 [Notothenia coriiceps]